MKTKTTLPHWVFDSSPIPDPHGRGERAVGFFKALRHPKSTLPGRANPLPYFWERIIRRGYGPSDQYGNRLTRTMYIQIPRGARKTTIGAGLGLLHSFGHEKIDGGSCLLAAGSEDQAQLAFDEANAFIKATPLLTKAARIVESELSLEHLKSGSILRAIPADGDVQHGKTPYFVLIDELHIAKNRRLWKALKSGLVKIPNTMLVIITTAGRGQDNLAYEEYKYAKAVAEGRIINPTYLPIIFEPPQGYDWRDESVWAAVNPGLREGFPDIIGMRQAAIEAVDKPSDLDDFRQYNLNEWLDSAISPFVAMDIYDEGGGEVDLEALKSQPCWLGVDLSSVHDLSVIVAAWRDGNDGYVIHPWFFCPGHDLSKRADRDGVPYMQWKGKGLITATPGMVIDHRVIEQKLREICEQFDVREIAFDRHLAQKMMSDLGDDGLPVVEFRQVPSLMMPAIQELERAIVGRKLNHGAHPILRWNFANVEVKKSAMGHKTHMVKSKETLRIDGAVAAAMAVSRASTGDDATSIYDSPDFDPSMCAW